MVGALCNMAGKHFHLDSSGLPRHSAIGAPTGTPYRTSCLPPTCAHQPYSATCTKQAEEAHTLTAEWPNV